MDNARPNCNVYPAKSQSTECALALLARLSQALVAVAPSRSDASPVRPSQEEFALAQAIRRSFHTSQDVKPGNRGASPTNDWEQTGSVSALQAKL